MKWDRRKYHLVYQKEPLFSFECLFIRILCAQITGNSFESNEKQKERTKQRNREKVSSFRFWTLDLEILSSNNCDFDMDWFQHVTLNIKQHIHLYCSFPNSEAMQGKYELNSSFRLRPFRRICFPTARPLSVRCHWWLSNTSSDRVKTFMDLWHLLNSNRANRPTYFMSQLLLQLSQSKMIPWLFWAETFSLQTRCADQHSLGHSYTFPSLSNVNFIARCVCKRKTSLILGTKQLSANISVISDSYFVAMYYEVSLNVKLGDTPTCYLLLLLLNLEKFELRMYLYFFSFFSRSSP